MSGWLFRFGDLPFRSIAAALNGDGVGVVKQAVENGGRQSGIVVKDAGPLFVGLVGRQDDGSFLVSLADHLEQEIGSGFVYRKITQFIHDQYRRRKVSSESPLELMGGMRGGKGVDDIHSRAEENRMTLQASGVPDCSCQMSFP